METVTLEKMQEIGDTYKAIEWAKSQLGEYPSRISKPKFPHGRSSVEAKQYAIELEAWENSKQDYDERMAIYRANEKAINDMIIKFIKEKVDLNSIPHQYREKVYSKAYSDGHSEGWYGVYQALDSLMEIFQ